MTTSYLTTFLPAVVVVASLALPCNVVVDTGIILSFELVFNNLNPMH